MKININTKYVIGLKILQYVKSKNDDKSIIKLKTLCPERILVRNFDETNLDGIEISRTSMKDKSYNLIKFYQAP